MRDLVLAIVILVLFVYSLRSGYIGYLGWVWFSMMSPHRLAFGWMHSMPVAQIMFLGLMVGLFFEKNKGKVIQHGIAVVQLVLIFWMIVTTIFAMFPEDSMVQFEKVFKIQLGIFLSYVLVNSREKLNWLLWVVYISIGFYGIKGGIFTIMSGGSSRVFGPDGSFIKDNNSLACALLMILPIGVYLMSITTNVMIKRGIMLSMGLIGISTLGSSSRGAMIGLLAVCLFWLRKVPGKQKILALLISALFGAVAVLMMPDAWWDRMNTVKTYDKDSSAMGRINAWWCAFNLAKDRLTGAGFEYYSPTAFALYAPVPEDLHAAHSIYFQMLGDHGFIGLVLFLIIAIWTWVLLGKIIRRTRDDQAFQWASAMARTIQLSLVGYFVAGAFLSLAYYDLYWQLVAISVILNTLTVKPLSSSMNQHDGIIKTQTMPRTFVRPLK